MKKKLNFPFESSNGTPTKTPAYQLVKERNHIDGTTYYWTCDHKGCVVSNTLTTKFGEAQRIFNIVCENDGRTVTKTILETYYEE